MIIDELLFLVIFPSFNFSELITCEFVILLKFKLFLLFKRLRYKGVVVWLLCMEQFEEINEFDEWFGCPIGAI